MTRSSFSTFSPSLNFNSAMVPSSFALMLVSRGMLGLGEGMHYPVQMKFVKNWFPPLERGKANSVWQFSLFVGPAIAMPFFAWRRPN